MSPKHIFWWRTDCDMVLHFHNHVNLITVSDHHHHQNSNLRCLQLSTTSSVPLFTWTFPWDNPKLLQAHYHWHILCQCYSVIISGYQLGLFAQHFNPWLWISGYGHAQNDFLYLSHVYSMSQNFLQNLVWALSSLLTNSLSCSLKFRTRRWWVAQHIHWGQSPIIIQVLCLRILLQVYIRLVQISRPD